MVSATIIPPNVPVLSPITQHTSSACVMPRSVAVPPLAGICYAGDTPATADALLALGARRRGDNGKDVVDGKDESCAKDRAYFVALLAARDRYRDALRVKLCELHTMRERRGKIEKMGRENMVGKRLATVAAMCNKVGASAHIGAAGAGKKLEMAKDGADGVGMAWDNSQETVVGDICASPVSLDEEIEERIGRTKRTGTTGGNDQKRVCHV